MDSAKDGIVFYPEWSTLIKSLPNEKRLQFYDIVLEGNYDEIDKIEDNHLKCVLEFVLQRIAINQKKYREKCEKAREAANSRWQQETHASASEGIQSHPDAEKRTITEHIQTEPNKPEQKETKSLVRKNSEPKRPKDHIIIIDEVLPAYLDYDLWQQWKEHRKSIKKPLTESTIKIQLKKFDEWYAKGHDPNKIIETSILNGYQGLFEPKQQNNYSNSYGKNSDNSAETDYQGIIDAGKNKDEWERNLAKQAGYEMREFSEVDIPF